MSRMSSGDKVPPMREHWEATFAIHNVARGTDQRSVQAALGHADLKTTSIQVHLARTVMKRQLQEHAL